MGELARPWNLMSLVRVPLAVTALALRADPVALVVLAALAGLSDVLDGWMARRAHADPRLSSWLDPVCDKVFVVAIVLAAWLEHHPPPWIALLALLREAAIGGWAIARAIATGTLRGVEYRSVPTGKATTCAQFAVVLAVVADRVDLAAIAAIAAAILGATAIAEYALRAHGPRAVRA